MLFESQTVENIEMIGCNTVGVFTCYNSLRSSYRFSYVFVLFPGVMLIKKPPRATNDVLDVGHVFILYFSFEIKI